MRKALFPFFALLTLVAALAADTLKTYPAAEARKHVGETAIVTGKVDGVRTLDSGLTLINLDGRYPEQACTVVVRAEHAKDVGDLSGLDGKTIAVKGTITDYKGKPQIEVTQRDAITEPKK
jgi:DNA/RNA endonuclease YhcR with UshA esterase domain